MFSVGLFGSSAKTQTVWTDSIDLTQDNKAINKFVTDLEAAYKQMHLETKTQCVMPRKPNTVKEKKLDSDDLNTIAQYASLALQNTLLVDQVTKSTIASIYAWRDRIDIFHSFDSLKSHRLSGCEFALKQAYQLQYWFDLLEKIVMKKANKDDISKVISASNLPVKPALVLGVYLKSVLSQNTTGNDFLNESFNYLQYSLEHNFNLSVSAFRAHAIAISTPSYSEVLSSGFTTAMESSKQLFKDLSASVSSYLSGPR